MIRRGISSVQTGLDPAQPVLVTITIIIITIGTVINHLHRPYGGRSDGGIVHGRHEHRSLSAILVGSSSFEFVKGAQQTADDPARRC